MLPHPLTNSEIRKYYQNEPKSSGTYSRINLPKIKYGAYVTNGVKHISKEIKKFIGNKNIITNVYRKQECHSIMCGYFCIGFFDFMLKDKTLLDFTNLFSPYDYEKNDEMIIKYFQ